MSEPFELDRRAGEGGVDPDHPDDNILYILHAVPQEDGTWLVQKCDAAGDCQEARLPTMEEQSIIYLHENPPELMPMTPQDLATMVLPNAAEHPELAGLLAQAHQMQAILYQRLEASGEI